MYKLFLQFQINSIDQLDRSWCEARVDWGGVNVKSLGCRCSGASLKGSTASKFAKDFSAFIAAKVREPAFFKPSTVAAFFIKIKKV